MPASELPQIAFVLFILAIAIVGYEMKLSVERPTCPECPHCKALAESAERETAELREYYARRYGVRRRDDDDRDP
jgi:hypothetical protein